MPFDDGPSQQSTWKKPLPQHPYGFSLLVSKGNGKTRAYINTKTSILRQGTQKSKTIN